MPSLIPLRHRGLLSMKGRDTFKYLQALTTNNLATPSSQFTSFLNAQGRVLFDAFIYRTGESGCLIETDARHLGALHDHLKRYKLRSKVEMRVLHSQETGIYQYMSQSMPSLDTVTVLQDPRAPGLGHRVVSSTSPADALETEIGDVGEYIRLRYRLGVPEGPEELAHGKALPMESNVDFMSGLDFHKGCYLGQELTVRTHHTGVIRKRIVPLKLTGEDGTSMESEGQWYPSEGETAEVSKPLNGTGRSGGRVLAAYGSLGLGLMRLQQMEHKYTATVNGKLVSIEAFRPEHWPKQPESV